MSYEPAVKPRTQTCHCSECGRVLWVEDGPTCPECLAKVEAKPKAKRRRRKAEPFKNPYIEPDCSAEAEQAPKVKEE